VTAWNATDPGLEVASASSAEEFVQALRRSNSDWWEGDRMCWAFRGQASISWALVPSAWRSDNLSVITAKRECEDRFDRLDPAPEIRWAQPGAIFGRVQFGPDDDRLARSLIIASSAELLLTWDFINTANDLGIVVPGGELPPDPVLDGDWLESPKMPLVADNILRYGSVPGQLALAQLHGIPIRLLDWSLDPLAAAFFAVDPVIDPSVDDEIVVYALHVNRAKTVGHSAEEFPLMVDGVGPDGRGPKVAPRLVVVRLPTGDNAYLAAQSGLFTTVTGSGIHFMRHSGERPDLWDFIAEGDPKDVVMRRITLKYEHVDELRSILRRERVTRAGLMPTFDNVAIDVKRRWS